MKIIREPIPSEELVSMARARFGDFVKVVVDPGRGIIAMDAELHADEEALLLEDGSRQEHLWGINLYPELVGPDRIEFDSMINIRPSQGNRSRGVDDATTRATIEEIVGSLLAS